MLVTLRALAPADRQALERILRATEAFTEQEVLVALELVDAGEEPAADGYRFVVAERDAKVAGYVCYGLVPLSDGAYDLYWIAVAPELQGAGIGRKLVDEVLQRVAGRQGRWVLIETASKPAYRATRAFYEALGFHEVARVPDFYRLGDDKVIYGKRVDARPP